MSIQKERREVLVHLSQKGPWYAIEMLCLMPYSDAILVLGFLLHIHLNLAPRDVWHEFQERGVILEKEMCEHLKTFAEDLFSTLREANIDRFANLIPPPNE